MEAPQNHLSAKRINNARCPSITHSEHGWRGPGWDGAYHTEGGELNLSCRCQHEHYCLLFSTTSLFHMCCDTLLNIWALILFFPFCIVCHRSQVSVSV